MLERTIFALADATGRAAGRLYLATACAWRSLTRGFLRQLVFALALCGVLSFGAGYAVQTYWTPVASGLGKLEQGMRNSAAAAAEAVRRSNEAVETLEERVARHEEELRLSLEEVRKKLDDLDRDIKESREKLGIGKTILMITPAPKEAVWAMVDAAMQCSRPELLLAVAIQETPELDPKARGDGGKAWGIFQIHRYCWDQWLEAQTGRKPTSKDYADPLQSARYAELIIERLYNVTGGDVRKTLRMYNGGEAGWTSPKTAAYAEDVLRSYALFREIRQKAAAEEL